MLQRVPFCVRITCTLFESTPRVQSAGGGRAGWAASSQVPNRAVSITLSACALYRLQKAQLGKSPCPPATAAQGRRGPTVSQAQARPKGRLFPPGFRGWLPSKAPGVPQSRAEAAWFPSAQLEKLRQRRSLPGWSQRLTQEPVTRSKAKEKSYSTEAAGLPSVLRRGASHSSPPAPGNAPIKPTFGNCPRLTPACPPPMKTRTGTDNSGHNRVLWVSSPQCRPTGRAKNARPEGETCNSTDSHSAGCVGGRGTAAVDSHPAGRVGGHGTAATLEFLLQELTSITAILKDCRKR